MQESRWLAAERYEVGEVVGRGGYGMVCRGLDRHTGNTVALKMLSPEAGRDADVVERMLREQQALVALSGTCAVTAIDLCRLESGAPCLVMEWLDGCDLEQQLSLWEGSGHQPSPEQLLPILKPLTETLARAHELGIVHRDIKPANVFLTKGEAPGVRLLDFGLSRMKSAAPLTAVGMVLGSPSYIAPETWRGNSTALDGRADLFALGVIVFRWLTGKLPFEAPDLIGKMTAVTSGPRPSAVAVRPELPAAVDSWLRRALAIEADDRFQTGLDFYEGLEAALRGESWPPLTEASGVRPVQALAAPERKSALGNAWQAAASLLKRFTSPSKRETLTPASTEAALAAPTPSSAPESERTTVIEPPSPPRPSPSTPSPSPSPTTPRSPMPTSRPVQSLHPEPATVWLDPMELEDAPESVLPDARTAEPAAQPDGPAVPTTKPKRKTRSASGKGKAKADKTKKAKPKRKKRGGKKGAKKRHD
jgi:eukaryotic-like serine/threonine-protein kinase